MKPVKAIDLVWKAQPAMSLLREILIRNRPNDSLISHLDEWLAQNPDDEGDEEFYGGSTPDKSTPDKK